MDGIGKPRWPLDFVRLGRLRGTPIAMVAAGAGRKLAGSSVDVVREHQNIDGLISVGFCGGLQPSLYAGDIFVATEVMGVAPALAPASPDSFKTGKLLSIDRVVSTAEEKAELRKTGADAVEMEAAALALRAQQYNIPFYVVRVITDTCDEGFPLDFNQMRSADGRFSRAKILRAALRRPGTVFPQLMKLDKRTKRAAQALGDFLAGARF